MSANVTALRPAEPVAEPDWAELFDDPAEIAAAGEIWRDVVREMGEAQTLTRANVRAIKRYIVACLAFDRAAAVVGRNGPVAKAKRTGTAAHSAWWTAVRDADAMAAQGEERLGLSPRTRGKVAPVKRVQPRPATAADRYLPPRHG